MPYRTRAVLILVHIRAPQRGYCNGVARDVTDPMIFPSRVRNLPQRERERERERRREAVSLEVVFASAMIVPYHSKCHRHGITRKTKKNPPSDVSTHHDNVRISFFFFHHNCHPCSRLEIVNEKPASSSYPNAMACPSLLHHHTSTQ